MDEWINEQVERVNGFLVRKPGVLPLIGLGFIVLNFLLQLFLNPEGWIVRYDLFLHFGLIISIIGLLLVNVYRH